MLLRNPFCAEGDQYPFEIRNDVRRERRTLVYNFATQGVKQMGRKLQGLFGSSLTAGLGISLMTPKHQAVCTVCLLQQHWNKSNNAGSNDGQCLKTT